jgi:hypothetical protein
LIQQKVDLENTAEVKIENKNATLSKDPLRVMERACTSPNTFLTVNTRSTWQPEKGMIREGSNAARKKKRNIPTTQRGKLCARGGEEIVEGKQANR